LTVTPSHIAVVTVTYNSEDVLDDFLDSLARQQGASFVLIAIDNASSDASLARLRSESRFPLEIVANAENLGVAEGNNQGILRALDQGFDNVLLLNNDTRFETSFLADLLRVSQLNDLSILCPLIAGIEPPGTVWFRAGHAHGWQGYLGRHDGAGVAISEVPRGSLEEVEYAPTCALLVRAEVFRRVGLMDPIYFVYFDDVDFCVRAKRAGYAYYVTTDVRMVHKASTLTGGAESEFSIRYMSRNWALAASRLNHPLVRPIAYAYIILWMLARFLLRRDSAIVYAKRRAGFREGIRSAAAPPPPAVQDAYIGGRA
jgi:GT2 family glycosyltransferase